VAWTLSSHNLPTGRARELIKPSKEVESLLALIKKSGHFWVWTFCGVMSWIFHDVIRAWEKNSSSNLLVLSFKNKLGKKSASLEPLIGHLALVVGKFWLKNKFFVVTNIYNNAKQAFHMISTLEDLTQLLSVTFYIFCRFSFKFGKSF